RPRCTASAVRRRPAPPIRPRRRAPARQDTCRGQARSFGDFSLERELVQDGWRRTEIFGDDCPDRAGFCGCNSDILGFSPSVCEVIFGGRRGSRDGGSILPERRLQALAAIASLLIACALASSLPTWAAGENAPPTCEEFGLAFLSSPAEPWKGAPLRVIFAAEKPLAGRLALIAPSGKIEAQSSEMEGGPPYFWFAEIASPEAGTWQAKLTREGAAAGCREVTREIAVERKQPRGPRAGKGVWPLHTQWNRQTENL